ncbi:hypothetical protein AB0M80_41525 [Amycolatopsis sp. NPDC051045]|uniref:Dyp-type peroxidase n=1 Tax=Amycolatopsis sp. NPDC051045 TaxID=3156922 RepID=UPI00342D8540
MKELLEHPNRSGITPGADQQVDALLADIQGNILKSHGRDHSTHLFLAFDDVHAAKKWLGAMATRVTSAKKQWDDSRARAEAMAAAAEDPVAWHAALTEKAARQAGTVFVNLLLSASGYTKLGLTPPPDEAFLDGAKKRASSLHDSPSSTWEAGFQQDVHAVVMLAEDDRCKVQEAASKLDADLAANPRIGKVLFTQKGAVIRTDEGGKPTRDGPPREHFGFLDGIADPLFFAKDISKTRPATGEPLNDSSAPLNLVLAQEPGRDSCGSYIVYRKLKQHVDRFTEDRDLLARNLSKNDRNTPQKSSQYYKDLAGAYIMGRFRNGSPVVTSSEPGRLTDEFNYAEDVPDRSKQGTSRCPLQSHIRKTNPRGDDDVINGKSLEMEREHRIVRRGVSYDDTKPEDCERQVGLLFLCAQASIEAQFEFMQASWANMDSFVKSGVGLDPVIGQAAGDHTTHAAQYWPKIHGQEGLFQFRVGGNSASDGLCRNWVTLQGAEYFFAPSLSFLRSCSPQGI